jgi:hypothetical protein
MWTYHHNSNLNKFDGYNSILVPKYAMIDESSLELCLNQPQSIIDTLDPYNINLQKNNTDRRTDISLVSK